jgi:hypothetical protein
LLPGCGNLVHMTTANAHRVINMDTPEGCAEWMASLPTDNLREIAARPVYLNSTGSNAMMVTAAAAELILRGVSS